MEPRRPGAHRYDAVQRFLVVVEQMDVVAELLAAGSLAKARMALVAADNLAELMLVRHSRKVFESSEGSHWMKRRRYSTGDRSKILRDFNQKLTLAQQPAEGPIWRSVEPILNPGDAAVLRVAHRYRNGVYHEDRHNATLLPAIAAIYLQAVGRMFCAGFTPGTAIGGGGINEQVKGLGKWGYELEEGRWGAGSFEFHAAAKTVVGQICDPLTVALPDLARVLSADLMMRSTRAVELVEALLKDGMPLDRLTFVILWSQFWEEHGSDEFSLELEEERRILSDKLARCATDERTDLEAELADTEEAYIGRSHELQKAFTPRVTLETLDGLIPAASQLAKAQNFTSLLERFERMDGELQALEDALDEASYAWGEMVDQAIDAARGA